jgi:hypothetical protein
VVHLTCTTNRGPVNARSLSGGQRSIVHRWLQHDSGPGAELIPVGWRHTEKLGLQDTPGTLFKASLIKELAVLDTPSRIIQEFLTSLGLVIDDREPAIVAWFASKITGLPEQMIREPRLLFEVMWHGHASSAPRSHVRHENTIRTRLNLALPALHSWTGRGHESLRKITRRDAHDVLDAFPTDGLSRLMTGSALHKSSKPPKPTT